MQEHYEQPGWINAVQQRYVFNSSFKHASCNLQITDLQKHKTHHDLIIFQILIYFLPNWHTTPLKLKLAVDLVHEVELHQTKVFCNEAAPLYYFYT